MMTRTILLVSVWVCAAQLADAQYFKASVTSFATSSGTFVDVPGGSVTVTPAAN